MDKTCVATAGLYCGLGMAVPIAPTFVGLGAVFVVRVLLWSKKHSFLWNIMVMILAMLATFVTLEGDTASTYGGFWIGTVYGGLGQGIISMGKSAVLATLQDRLTKAMDAFMGTKTPPPTP